MGIIRLLVTPYTSRCSQRTRSRSRGGGGGGHFHIEGDGDVPLDRVCFRGHQY